MLPGIELDFHQKKLYVPGMSLRIQFAMEDTIEKLKVTEGKTAIAYAKEALPLVFETIKRNYPDMTIEEFQEIADTETLMQALQVIFGQSGFVPLTVGTPEQPGNLESP